MTCNHADVELLCGVEKLFGLPAVGPSAIAPVFMVKPLANISGNATANPFPALLA
jgi:hypothetical protein